MRHHVQNRTYETTFAEGAPLNLRILGEVAAKQLLKGATKK